MRRNKFYPGDPFTTVSEVVEWLNDDGWIYWHGRPKHPKFMVHLSIAMLRQLVKYRTIARAHPTIIKERPCWTRICRASSKP